MFLLNFIWMVKEYPGVGVADVSGTIDGEDTAWFWCFCTDVSDCKDGKGDGDAVIDCGIDGKITT